MLPRYPRFAFVRSLRFAVAAFLLVAGAAAAQDAPMLRVQSNEVVADLVAVDHNSYQPDQTLTARDLVITDNGLPVSLTSFTRSDKASLRPLAVWVVTQCDLKHWDMSGSKFAQGRLATMAEGMRHLNPEDTVAAAGWCDDGRQQVDAPSHDAALVTRNLEQWMTTRNAPLRTSRRSGEVALQTMLRGMTQAVATMRPRPLPVLVFLHQDDTGTNGDEYTATVKILLEQSSIVFLATDGKGVFRPSPQYLASGNVAHILGAFSADTGGSAFVLGSFQEHPNVLSDVFATIVDRLHGRYEFSFVPQQRDGRVHSLAVKFTDAGRAAHGGVLLQTRRSYLAPGTK